MLNGTKIRVAILDLYEGQPNQGMRCIREILRLYREENHLDLITEEFDVRQHKQVPGLDFDIYISSGGPGSPLENSVTDWESAYFNWIDAVRTYNNDPANALKKYILFICHSFQLAARHFAIGHVSKRKSTAFGVFPVHITHEQQKEQLFKGLPDPFYAVDSRDFQVIEPNQQKLDELGAAVLAIEKERPHVPLERAVMAMRFNEYMLGTQFHPEADATGMSMYLQRDDKEQTVIENHGFDKWQSMIEQLNDPDKIGWTYAHVIPNFLDEALAGRLHQVSAR